MDLSRVVHHAPVTAMDEEREAAVLVPVVERADGPSLLFTRRADHLGDHPGQMSFPGGGWEPGDESLEETALREAYEEIGLRPEEAVVVGRLDDVRTVSNYSVRPFVATVPDREYVREEREVAEIVLLPVSGLVDPANYRAERRSHPRYGEVTVHYFHVDGYTVWGATGRVLVQFLELVTDWHPPSDPAAAAREE